MKFKIGDKVCFLNEKGEGTITTIINKTTVGVTIEEDFIIPYAISELVSVNNDTDHIPSAQKAIVNTSVEETRRSTVETKKILPQKEKEGIYIAFSPENINDITYSDFNVWLINATNYKILFTYSLFQNGSYITIETGTIKENASLLLETINRKKLHDYSTFKIDILFFDEKPYSPQPPITELIKLKPVKLYKENAFAVNDFIPDKALVIDVCSFDNYEEKINLQPQTDLSKILFRKQTYSETSKKSKPHINNGPAYEMEIDLHIEELLDNYKGMSNAEIIQVQLKHFQQALDKAINEHYRKLIIIHGVGNGRLKHEVRTILSSYKNLQYYDASYSKYGFGATEILIH